MAEYIERDGLEFPYMTMTLWGLNRETCHAYNEGIKAAADYIASIPAADVAPVRHGEWISLTECANAGVYCSVCHKKVYKEDYAWSNKRIKMRSNYCPNCGCRMDKDGE